MRADHLDHAIELQNSGDYALTGGIHSLDETEVEQWLAEVEVGNAYVNRHITGAIVQRQPFGGWKRSAVGGGAKAGGPGYVAQFARITDLATGAIDRQRLRTAMESTWQRTYCTDHDPSGLIAESNILRSTPLDRVEARHDGDASRRLCVLGVAAEVTGTALALSCSDDETDIEFAQRVANSADRTDRVRLLTELSDDARRVLHAADVVIDVDEPVTEPAIELQHWVREQSISRTRHRHGRLVR
jgi:RHH-type proline utilization regulon transcriptional repressor/proline dehydrogenase/delta 1-pyrroline-5-carboxylate dehydrogenase